MEENPERLARQRAASRRRNLDRQAGIRAAEDVAAAAQEGLDRFDERAAGRGRQIRGMAAQGMAAGLDYGMATGGGFLGAAGQVGMDAAMQTIRQEQADEERRLGLRTGAARARQESAEYKATAGNRDEDYTVAIANAESAIEEAIRNNRNWYNDDEEAMNSAVRAEIAKVALQSPEAAEELRKKYLVEGAEGYKQIYD